MEYTAFTSTRAGPDAGAGHRPAHRPPGPRHERQRSDGQEELFPAWRYHAVFTDSPFEMIQAEEHHRDHAIIEQVFAN